ncbi:MAG: 3-dehydroquinate synthase, partial [Bacteroidota bacterium]|nr:3-dehydroquinate synthase [Bacteroidota bacterium]
FTASCFQRGITFAHIPTTVMAMTDAAIGGKTGVDFNSLKNYIGLIRQPAFIWIDPVFLHTLPHLESISGLAEVIKHAIIGNPAIFHLLGKFDSIEEIQWATLFEESIAVKLRIAEADTNEIGLRKTLNFGHTIGHAIESHFLDSEAPLTHGQSITLGMLAEARMAQLLNLLSDNAFQDICNLILHWLEPIRVTLPTFEILKTLIEKDKKKGKAGVGYSLPTAIGSCRWDVQVEEATERESIHWLTTQVLTRS